MTILSLFNISKSFSGVPLFEGATFSISKNSKISIVGRNGNGKTTLLNIISGKVKPDSGEIVFKKDLRISYMSQQESYHGTIFDFMKDEHKEILSIENKLEECVEPEVLEKLMTEYESKGGYTYLSEIRSVLVAMGFPESSWGKRVDELSGGEFIRLKLSRVLASGADLLLLDEPTNHLDMTMIIWLENFILSFPGAVLFITHDRRFLEKTASGILHLFNRSVKNYSCGYSKFLKIFQEELVLMKKVKINNENRIKIYEDFIRRNRAGIKSHQVRSRQNMVDRLSEDIKNIHLEKNIKIAFSKNLKESNVVVEGKNLTLGYSKPLFGIKNFKIYRGDKVCLMGENGSGKSTLIKTILGLIPPIEGEIEIGKNVEIGYYEQSLQGLNLNNKLIDEIYFNSGIDSINQVYTVCAQFGFDEDDLEKKIEVLSGGEKSKVVLLKLFLKKPNFLVLDEPTNHLDIPSIESLKNALLDYDGTLLIISHDRYFLEDLTDRVLVIKEGEFFDDILSCDEAVNKYFKNNNQKDNLQKNIVGRGVIQKTKINLFKINEKKNEIESLETELEMLYEEMENDVVDWEMLTSLKKKIEEIEECLIERYMDLEKLEGQ